MFLPVDLHQAIERFCKGESLWVRSVFTNEWVEFKKSFYSPPLFDRVRQNCGLWRKSDLEKAFYVKQSINGHCRPRTERENVRVVQQQRKER